jgi:hypothetical protein
MSDPPTSTLGWCTTMEGFSSQPLDTVLLPKLTLRLVVRTKGSSTSPTTLPTTSGSLTLSLLAMLLLLQLALLDLNRIGDLARVMCVLGNWLVIAHSTLVQLAPPLVGLHAVRVYRSCWPLYIGSLVSSTYILARVAGAGSSSWCVSALHAIR